MKCNRRAFIQGAVAIAGVASATVVLPTGVLAAPCPREPLQLAPEQVNTFCDKALRTMKIVEIGPGTEVCTSCMSEGMHCLSIPIPMHYIDIKVSLPTQ